MKRETKEKLKKLKAYQILVTARRIKRKVLDLVYPIILLKEDVNRSAPREIGIQSEESLGKKVIVSLTSFPDRIDGLDKTICSLLHQSYKPNLIILWLARTQFPNGDKDLPDRLLDLKKYGLSIEWVDDDIRSYKKLIPALKEYPNDIIITADDDLYYPRYMVERLIDSYLANPATVHCHLTTKVIKEKEIIRFIDRYGSIGDGDSSYNNKILGGSGTLYPPHSLDEEVANQEAFMNLAPTNDDIWFWAMAIKNNTKVTWIKNGMRTLFYVEGSQENTPCLVDINNHGENLRLKQMHNVFDKYNLFGFLEEN